jgi:hypothetical protein
MDASEELEGAEAFMPLKNAAKEMAFRPGDIFGQSRME